jgi:hypothetical protein
MPTETTSLNNKERAVAGYTSIVPFWRVRRGARPADTGPTGPLPAEAILPPNNLGESIRWSEQNLMLNDDSGIASSENNLQWKVLPPPGSGGSFRSERQHQ